MTPNAPQRLQALSGLSEWDLRKALRNDRSDVVRHEAAFLLGQAAKEKIYDLQGTLDDLDTAASDSSILVRHEAALALANFKAERSVSILARLVTDDAIEVRDSALYALVQMAT
jgi:HEAT repeat protein